MPTYKVQTSTAERSFFWPPTLPWDLSVRVNGNIDHGSSCLKCIFGKPQWADSDEKFGPFNFHQIFPMTSLKWSVARLWFSGRVRNGWVTTGSISRSWFHQDNGLKPDETSALQKSKPARLAMLYTRYCTRCYPSKRHGLIVQSRCCPSICHGFYDAIICHPSAVSVGALFPWCYPSIHDAIPASCILFFFFGVLMLSQHSWCCPSIHDAIPAFMMWSQHHQDAITASAVSDDDAIPAHFCDHAIPACAWQLWPDLKRLNMKELPNTKNTNLFYNSLVFGELMERPAPPSPPLGGVVGVVNNNRL